MQAQNGLSTIGLDFIVDNDMTRIHAIDSYMDDGTHVMTVVPTSANTVHHLRITYTYHLIANTGTDAFACHLLDIADLTTVGSLVRKGIAQSCTDGMRRKVFDVSSEM